MPIWQEIPLVELVTSNDSLMSFSGPFLHAVLAQEGVSHAHVYWRLGEVN